MSFQNFYEHNVQFLDGTYTITSNGENFGDTIDTLDGDQLLSPGEEIYHSYFNDVDHVTLTYVGAAGDGFVASSSSGGYYYFSTTPHAADEVLSVSPATFSICFMAGTVIAVPGGVRAVEDLAIGDEVLTSEGARRPIRWIGRQTIIPLLANPLRDMPVAIAAGALGEGLPCRDLRVSPAHALMIDGLLVEAGALVNGTTVRRMTGLSEAFTYYHVELTDHSLILAEGMPAETFIDNVSRRRFDNGAEYEALYGVQLAAMAELPAPRVKSARQLPRAIQLRLMERAAALGVETAEAA